MTVFRPYFVCVEGVYGFERKNKFENISIYWIEREVEDVEQEKDWVDLTSDEDDPIATEATEETIGMIANLMKKAQTVLGKAT